MCTWLLSDPLHRMLSCSFLFGTQQCGWIPLYVSVCRCASSFWVYSLVPCSWTSRFLVDRLQWALILYFCLLLCGNRALIEPFSQRCVDTCYGYCRNAFEKGRSNFPISSAWNSYCPTPEPRPHVSQLMPVRWRLPVYSSQFRCLDISTWCPSQYHLK